VTKRPWISPSLNWSLASLIWDKCVPIHPTDLFKFHYEIYIRHSNGPNSPIIKYFDHVELISGVRLVWTKLENPASFRSSKLARSLPSPNPKVVCERFVANVTVRRAEPGTNFPGFSIEKAQYKNFVFYMWDLGGQESSRKNWKQCKSSLMKLFSFSGIATQLNHRSPQCPCCRIRPRFKRSRTYPRS